MTGGDFAVLAGQGGVLPGLIVRQSPASLSPEGHGEEKGREVEGG